MKFKDTPNYPSALRNLLTRDLHIQTGKYSVTGLIAPPRLMQLRKRHADEIIIDPADRIWMLFGTLAHAQLEAVAGKNTLAEELLTIDINGITVSGSADVLEDGIIYDYKTTSAYSVKEGIKDEWIKQVSMYATMYRSHGFEVKAGRIVAILRDWSKSKAKQDASYPQEPIQISDVPLMSNDETLAYMSERVALHEAAEKLADDNLPICTPEERWERPAKFAVMKKGRKSAIKLYDSKFEAEVALEDGQYIEHRPGECVRCNEYCEVNAFCAFYCTNKACKAE